MANYANLAVEKLILSSWSFHKYSGDFNGHIVEWWRNISSILWKWWKYDDRRSNVLVVEFVLQSDRIQVRIRQNGGTGHGFSLLQLFRTGARSQELVCNNKAADWVKRDGICCDWSKRVSDWLKRAYLIGWIVKTQFLIGDFLSNIVSDWLSYLPSDLIGRPVHVVQTRCGT